MNIGIFMVGLDYILSVDKDITLVEALESGVWKESMKMAKADFTSHRTLIRELESIKEDI